jgi:hypothetical protein
LQIGAIGGTLAGPYLLTPPMLTAHGKIRSMLKIQVIGSSAFLCLAYFASRHSLQAVAVAVLAAGFVRLTLMQIALTECTGVTFAGLVSACSRSALIALLTVAAAAPALVLNDGSLSGALACLLMAGVSSGLILFGAIFALNHPLAREISNIWIRRNKMA